MEKIAVLAPMESASVKMTVKVKPGLRVSWRAANLRCWLKVPIEADPFPVPGLSSRA
jgi:hypothetical protein